jgi:hypothetical protein
MHWRGVLVPQFEPDELLRLCHRVTWVSTKKQRAGAEGQNDPLFFRIHTRSKHDTRDTSTSGWVTCVHID